MDITCIDVDDLYSETSSAETLIVNFPISTLPHLDAEKQAVTSSPLEDSMTAILMATQLSFFPIVGCRYRQVACLSRVSPRCMPQFLPQ
jgi:hypothetical protein